MTDREVMQQALEALVTHGCAYLHHAEEYGAAIKALRARLAEPEPVAHKMSDLPMSGKSGFQVEEPVSKYRSCSTHCCPVHGCKYGHRGCPVYLGRVKPEHPNNNGCEDCESEPGSVATPPTRRPLTDEEIDDIWNRYCDEMGEASINDAYDIARAIERAHKIGGNDE
jgi:hypothetical protein